VIDRRDSIGFHVVVASSVPSKQDGHCWDVGIGNCRSSTVWQPVKLNKHFEVLYMNIGFDITDFEYNKPFRVVPEVRYKEVLLYYDVNMRPTCKTQATTNNGENHILDGIHHFDEHVFHQLMQRSNLRRGKRVMNIKAFL